MKKLIIVIIILQIVIIGMIYFCVSNKQNNFLTEKEIGELQNDAEFAKRIDSETKTHNLLIINEYSKKYSNVKNAATYEEKMNAVKDIDQGNAREYIKNFRTFKIGPKTINQHMGNNYFTSIALGENSVSDFTNFIDLYRKKEIDGVRIYLAKYDASVEPSNAHVASNDFTLIMVGILKGKDVVKGMGPNEYIQNYGDPCKPRCPFGNTTNFDDDLGFGTTQ